jgi:hypothetical protein
MSEKRKWRGVVRDICMQRGESWPNFTRQRLLVLMVKVFRREGKAFASGGRREVE